MKNSVIYIIIGILIGIVGIEIFLVYNEKDSLKKQESYTDYKKDSSSDDNKLISKESILELSKNQNLNIDTSFLTKIEIDQDYDGNIYSLEYNNNLYLKTDKKESLVTNFNEEIITLVDAKNSCAIGAEDILILTSLGNLYMLEGSDIGESLLDEEVVNNLKNNKNVELKFIKLNPDSIKVLGIVKSNGDSRSSSCGFKTQIIYTNDNRFREYKSFNIVDKIIIDYVGYLELDSSKNYGFVVYSDNTLSIKNDNTLVKNKNNQNLIIKEYYYGETNSIFILDEDNYLYEMPQRDSNGTQNQKVVNLYKNIKVEKVQKTESNVNIIFSDNSKLNIKYS